MPLLESILYRFLVSKHGHTVRLTKYRLDHKKDLTAVYARGKFTSPKMVLIA